MEGLTSGGLGGISLTRTEDKVQFGRVLRRAANVKSLTEEYKNERLWGVES